MKKFIKKVLVLPISTQNQLFYALLCVFLYFARLILVFSEERWETAQILGLIVLFLAFLLSVYFLCFALFRQGTPAIASEKLTFGLIFSLFAHFFGIFFVYRNERPSAEFLENYEALVVSFYCVQLIPRVKTKSLVLLGIYGFFVYQWQLFQRKNLLISFLYSILSVLLILQWFLLSYKENCKENSVEISHKTNEILMNDRAKIPMSASNTLNYMGNSENFTKISTYPQRILDSIKEGIIVFDKSLRIRWKNKFIKKLFPVEQDVNAEKLKEIVLNIAQDENYLKLQNNFLGSKKHFDKLFKAFQTKIEPLKNLYEMSGNDQVFVEDSINLGAESLVFQENTLFQSNNNEYFVNDNVNLKSIHCVSSPFIQNPNRIKRLKDFLSEIFASSCENTDFIMSSSVLLNFQNYNMYGVHENLLENEKKMYFIRFFPRKDEIVVMIKYMPENDLIMAALRDSLDQSSLLASMCHELKTPLNYITNILEVMKKDSLDKENIQNEYIGNALMNCKLLISSVNDFLDFFSINSDLFRLNLELFDLEQLMCESFELFQFLAEKKHVKYTLFFDENIGNPLCFNDKKRLQQIILNLLNNAFKYTRNNGEIALQARNLQKFDSIEIVVEDTGSGISSKTLMNLGNITSMSTNSEINGGLGICISNYLANYIGTKMAEVSTTEGFYKGLKIKTEVGVGTKFSFIIPKGKNVENIIGVNEKSYEIDESSARINEEESKIHENIRVLKNNQYVFMKRKGKNSDLPRNLRKSSSKCECPLILGVDDNPYNLLILQEQFKKFHCKICTENSGVDAIEVLRDLLAKKPCNKYSFCQNCKFFRLILMDIEMPVKNGLETTKELREIFKTFNVKCYIVGVSAFKQTEFKGKALEAGMDDYIEKPLLEKNFRYLIERYLQ